MDAKPYYYNLSHPRGVVVRALLNDLPLYRGGGDEPVAVTGPANHLLLPGENVLTLEVTLPDEAAPQSARSRARRASTPAPAVRFAMMVDDEDDTVVHTVVGADVWQSLPEAERLFPFVHVSRFEVDTRIGRPVYLDAPRARFGPDGTPEQHEAVREVYRAFEKGDAQAFLRAHELKLSERQRAYPGFPELSVDRQREKIAARFAGQWKVRPVNLRDMKELVFESRAEGRVAYVTRADGRPAVEAVAAADPTNTVVTDLFLTRQKGAWRVFR